MKIGSKVKVSAIAKPDYIDNKRRWIRTTPKKLFGWYVGYAYKQEGKYNPDNIGQYLEDYEPARLSEVVAVKLLRVKFSENSNDSFAYPEDVMEVTR